MFIVTSEPARPVVTSERMPEANTETPTPQEPQCNVPIPTYHQLDVPQLRRSTRYLSSIEFWVCAAGLRYATLVSEAGFVSPCPRLRPRLRKRRRAATTGTEETAVSAAIARVVRMGLRPPPRFPANGDWELWVSRFELYVLQANISEGLWTKELLTLLEDEPFRVVSRQGLACSNDYKAVCACLQQHFAPVGNELEWQFKIQNRVQKESPLQSCLLAVPREILDPMASTASLSSKIISEVEVFVGAAAKLAESQNTNEMTPNLGDMVGTASPFDTIPPKCSILMLAPLATTETV
eukprot:Em0005g432a